jgi:DNA-binding phage protein
MPLRRDFRETIKARAERDPEFRRALLTEAVELFLDDDFETGKAVLRNYVNAAIGFQTLAELTEISAQSLMRMLSPAGNPTAQNLFNIVNSLMCNEGVQLKVQAVMVGEAGIAEEDQETPLNVARA